MRQWTLALITITLWVSVASAADENISPEAPAVTVVEPATASTEAPTVYDLEKIVVTPSRTAGRAWLTTPQSVAVVTDEKISTSPKLDADDYLRDIPGIGMAPSGSTGQTSANSSNRNSDYWNDGFTVRGLGAQRVLILSDGVRQSGQGTGYGGGNLSLYDMNSIERVEVLKGPGSVLYGTDAFGGVVQVFTRAPRVRESFGANGRLRAAYDDGRNTLTSGGWADVGGAQWGLVAGGSRTEAGEPNLPQNNNPQGGSFDKNGGFFKFDYRPNADTNVRLLGNVTEAKDIVSYDTAFGAGRFFFHIPFYRRALMGAEIEQKRAGETLERWKVGVYEQELKRRLERSTPIIPSAPYAFDKTLTKDRVRTTELQGNADFALGAHTLTLGADVGMDRAYLTEVVTTTGTPVGRIKTDAVQTRGGVYAQDLWKLGAHEWTLGARYDAFNLSNDINDTEKSLDGLSGSVGYTYHMDPSTALYATAASGFRSPDLDERYQNTVLKFFNQTVTVQGNPELKAERSMSMEVGAKKDAEDLGRFEVAAYYNTIDNFIGEVQTSSTFAGPTNYITKEKRNIGTVALYGAEAAWRTPAASAWHNFASLNRTWTDSPAAISLPNYRIGYGVARSFALKPFTRVTPSWTGNILLSSRDTISNVRFSTYHVVNTQVAFEWGTSANVRTQWVVGIKNLFNAEYCEPFFAQLQPARGLFTSIQVDF